MDFIGGVINFADSLIDAIYSEGDRLVFSLEMLLDYRVK